jgi:putative ABC transport system permease protein
VIVRILLKLAMRDLLRNRRRTSLVGLTVLIGAMVIVLNGGMVSGVRKQLLDNLVINQTGHLQIRARGTAAARKSDFGSAEMIERPEEIAALVSEWIPGSLVSARLASLGMVFSEGASSSRVVLVGIEPERAPRLLRQLRERSAGPWEGLRSGQICVGSKLARRLDLELGSIVTAMAATSVGDLDATDLEVVAVLGPGAPWQDYFAYLPLKDLQELTGAGPAVQEIQVTLEEDGPTVASAARTLAEGVAASRPDLQVLTYGETGRFFLGMITASRIQMGVMDAVLLIAVSLTVAGAQLLAVNERRREIGTMMALGTARGMVLGLFVMEGVLMTIVFGALGVAAGGVVTATLGRSGVGLSAEAFRWMIGGTLLFPLFTWPSAARALLGLIAAVSLGSFYPAWHAATIDPARTLSGDDR